MLNSAAPSVQPTPVIVTREAPLVAAVKQAFRDALDNRGAMSPRVYDVDGICGRKFRLFLNNLVRGLEAPRYLEIGIYKGATLCAAISENRLRAIGIDNWSEYGGPATEFYEIFARFKHQHAVVSILEQDFRSIDYGAIGKFNILFYDGSHAEVDQYDGVRVPVPAMDDQFILLVDDWNWERVQVGTRRALADQGLRIEFAIELLTSDTGDIPPLAYGGNSDWHNGFFAAVVSKPAGRS